MGAVSFSVAVPGSFYSGEEALRTDDDGRPNSLTTKDISVFGYHEPERTLERYFLGFNDQAFGTRALEITIVSGDPSHLTLGWGANSNTFEYPGPITPDVDGAYIHGSGGIYLRSSGSDTLLYSTSALAVGDVISFKHTGYAYGGGAIALNGTEYEIYYGAGEGLLVASTLGLDPGLLDDGGGGDEPLPEILPPIPLPFRAPGHGFVEDDVYADVQPATGHARRRRLYTVSERTVDVSWLLSAANAAIVDEWYEDVLAAGSAFFSIQVQGQDSLDLLWWRAKWLGPLTFAPREGDIWLVSGRLKLYGDQGSASAPASSPLGLELRLPLYGSASVIVSTPLGIELELPLLGLQTLGALDLALPLTN